MLLFLLNVLPSFGQEVPVDIQGIDLENPEPGKCYISELTEQSESNSQILERPFIIEIFPPKYEEIEITFKLDSLESQFENSSLIRVQTSPSHAKFVRKEDSRGRFEAKENLNSFIFCVIEVPSTWRTLSKENFKNDIVKVKGKKLIEKAKISKTYVDARPTNLTKNQSFHKGGYWSQAEYLHGGSGCGSGFTIRDIQEKLVELGYDVEVNNIMNEETKFTLIHFQRKNGIEEGSLNLETLKKLGVIHL